MMKRGIYILPNFITMGNMFCGFYAIIAVINGAFQHAAIAILIAGILDGLDGWVARMTNATSRFGVEFDSLADLVSFGVAPALLGYNWVLRPMGRIGWSAALLFVICGALRLARFNVQFYSSESKHFTGLPIPTAAGMIASLVILYDNFQLGVPKPLFIILLTYMLAFLMVSTIKYRSLKEVHMKKRHPFSLLVFASLALFVMAAEPQLMLFMLFSLYTLSGILESIFLHHGLVHLPQLLKKKVHNKVHNKESN
jgi:CDP-diacylglycerol--serine O-phosphatidyltransferase